MPTSISKPPPESVGPYQLLRRLGAGGMGEVFLAERKGPQGFVKEVVIKRLLSHQEFNADARDHFIEEARLTARLSHPNVVQVHELGEHAGHFFIAMEYVPGASLRQLLDALHKKGEKLPAALAGWVCSQILRGLHHAHELKNPQGEALGLVHRDVSPENVLLGESGTVKVGDFGIAKAFLASDFRISGVVRGKVAYMSPEQLQGGHLDRRSDVYAVGVILYELLAGQTPFAPRPEIAANILTAPPPPLLADEGSLEAALEALAQKALAKSSGQRFESAEQMAEQLEQCLRLHPAAGAPQLCAVLAALNREGALTVLPASDAPTGTRPLPPQAAASAGEEIPRASGTSPRTFRWAWATLGGLLVGAGFWSLRPAPAPPLPPAPVLAPVVQAPPAPPPEALPIATPPPRKSPRAAPVATAEVSLRAHPWAEVFLEGESLGVTPMAPLKLRPGRYTFVFRNQALKTEKRVTRSVRAGTQTLVKVDLRPKASR